MNSFIYEVRKDYFSERYVAYSRKRAFRPVEFKEKVDYSDDSCVFCPGSEDKTPPEIGRYPLDKEWQIRWVENKYPIFGDMPVSDDLISDTLFPGNGKHYVIVETNKHSERMHQYSVDHFVNLFKVISQISDEFDKVGKYVHYFKNEGKDSGASLKHSHSQILAFPFVPKRIRDIAEAISKKPFCYMEKIIADEKKGPRFVMETEHFSVFCPYASIFPFEVWVVPKKHIRKISHFVLNELEDLARIFKSILPIVYSLKTSYNVILSQAPRDADFHLFFQILPRMSTWAGVELGTDTIVNTVLPENAASYYREKLSKNI